VNEQGHAARDRGASFRPNPPSSRQQEVVASGGLDSGSISDYGVYLTVAQPAAGMANCSGLPLTDTV